MLGTQCLHHVAPQSAKDIPVSRYFLAGTICCVYYCIHTLNHPLHALRTIQITIYVRIIIFMGTKAVGRVP